MSRRIIRLSDQDLHTYVDDVRLVIDGKGRLPDDKGNMAEMNEVEKISSLNDWVDRAETFADNLENAVKKTGSQNQEDMEWPSRLRGVIGECKNAIEVFAKDDPSDADVLYPGSPGKEKY